MSETKIEVSLRDAVNFVLSGEITDAYDGRSVFPARLEEDRTLRVASILKALGADGNEGLLNLDSLGNLRVVVSTGVPTLTRRIVDPLLVAVAPGANLWSPALGATGYLDFEVFLCNESNPAVASAVDLRIDPSGGANRYLLRGFNMPANYQFKLPHTVRMGTNDVLWASAVVANAISVHIRIVDEGTAT